MLRRFLSLAGAAALLLVLGAVASASATTSASPLHGTARTLRFDVRFSPFFLLDLGDRGFSKGDQTIFHDLLLSEGRTVGDDGGSCVIVDLVPTAPDPLLVNCTVTYRLPGGQLTTQGLVTNAPTKLLAITGGTGAYQGAQGQATLVELGPDTGTLTFELRPQD
jgi:hypothetical protein